MQTVKIVALIAAVLFFLYALIGLLRWTCAEWKKIEAEEAELRRQAGLRAVTRSGI